MICDTCISWASCRIRRSRGKHDEECKGYFPDWTMDRSPKAPGTPEDRRRPMETREA